MTAIPPFYLMIQVNQFKEDPNEFADQLFFFFEKWQKIAEEAEPIFDFKVKRLAEVAVKIPAWQVYYAQQLQDIKTVVKWLENMKAKLEAKYSKNYSNSPKAFGIKETQMMINGEKEIIELNQIIIEAVLHQNYFTEIVDAIKQMGWMLTNVTKLRVSEAEDTIL